MILIADAGGTKTDWRLLEGESISQFSTRGYNPNTHRFKDFLNEIIPTFSHVKSQVTKLYFYGASIYPTNVTFKKGIGGMFPNAQIEIDNDLLGTCRSLSADQPGFIGILGTGSAGCYYDGKKIVDHPPSLGYALGDEGSGAILGKAVVNLALRKRLDESVQQKFDDEFQLSKEEAYKYVYMGEAPNTYLASFTRFLLSNKSNSQMDEVIRNEFRKYYNAFFLPMDNLKEHAFHFSGSVAYFFGDYLREIGAELGLTVKTIVQSPIEGLALYHQEHG